MYQFNRLNGRARKKLRMLVWERDSINSIANCFWCNNKLFYKLGQVDHIIPLGIGGNNTLENSVWSCYKCNHLRGLALDLFLNLGINPSCEECVFGPINKIKFYCRCLFVKTREDLLVLAQPKVLN